MGDFNLRTALKWLTLHKALLLDIRYVREYCESHLAGAIIIPTQLPPLSDRERTVLRDQLWNVVKLYPKTKHIVLYCKKGKRAEIAKQLLRNMGYRYVINLGGVEEGPLKNLINSDCPIWPVVRCFRQ